MNLRTRGEGVQKSENFADALNGSPIVSGDQPIYVPSEVSDDSQGISTDVCDLSVVHLGVNSTCLADRDGGKWCQKRVVSSSESPIGWRSCNDMCPISYDKGTIIKQFRRLSSIYPT